MNTKTIKLVAFVVLVSAFWGVGSLLAEQVTVVADASPMRYTSVSGNSSKFREQHWMNDGYAGGIEDFSLEANDLPGDWSVEGEGHAIPADNDYEANLMIQKKDFGYTKFEYEEFTKYYDNSGGYFYPYGALSTKGIDHDLELQIGHFRVETGLTIEDLPQVTFAYERHFKDGDKSRLTWGAVKEGALTRNIAPSFQEINEGVNIFEAGATYEIKGIELKNKEHWEGVSSETSRYEFNFTTAATATDKKTRRQDLSMKNHLFSSMSSIEKWFGEEERVFTGGAYHFMHMSNTEYENIFEMNEFGEIRNFSANAEQVRNAFGSNDYESSSWVGSFMVIPWKPLSFDAKFKAETIEQSGDSVYPKDRTPNAAAGTSSPDGVIDSLDTSRTKNNATRFGESISVHFTAIPRTVLYNDFELEQVHNDLEEHRNSASVAEIFDRETVATMLKGVWTIGAQFYPCKFVDGFLHFRMNHANTDYDDEYETVYTSGAKSAFTDGLDVHSNEIGTHWVFKPVRWFRPGVHYKYLEKTYTSSAENLKPVDAWEKTQNMILDVTVEPLKNWLVVSGISRQYGWVTTSSQAISPSASPTGSPRFSNSNWTGFMNTTYNICEHVSVFGGMDYAVANNFNDFTSTGLPLAAEYNQFDISTGVNVNISKYASVQLEYAYYLYKTGGNSETGDYTANQIGVKTKLTWG